MTDKLFVILICSVLMFSPSLFASGLDVQLKDLRDSYFYIPNAGPCKKLVSSEIIKYGRLVHCNPESDQVVCKIKIESVKDGKLSTKLFAHETLAACEAARKNSSTP